MTNHSIPRFCRASCALLVLCLTLPACGKRDDGQTVGQKLDTAVSKTEQAAAEAKVRAASSMARAGESIKEVTQQAEVSGKKTAKSVSEVVDDMAVTARVSAEYARDRELSVLKIDVSTKQGKVTLAGQAPTAAAKDKASAIAKAVKGVIEVDNQLVVKAG